MLGGSGSNLNVRPHPPSNFLSSLTVPQLSYFYSRQQERDLCVPSNEEYQPSIPRVALPLGQVTGAAVNLVIFPALGMHSSSSALFTSIAAHPQVSISRTSWASSEGRSGTRWQRKRNCPLLTALMMRRSGIRCIPTILSVGAERLIRIPVDRRARRLLHLQTPAPAPNLHFLRSILLPLDEYLEQLYSAPQKDSVNPVPSPHRLVPWLLHPKNLPY